MTENSATTAASRTERLAHLMMPSMVGDVSYVAMTYTSVINAGVIVTSTPVMTVLLSWLILRGPIRGAVWLGISMAIGLVYLVSARFGAALFRRTKERDFRRIVLWMMLALASAGLTV